MKIEHSGVYGFRRTLGKAETPVLKTAVLRTAVLKGRWT